MMKKYFPLTVFLLSLQSLFAQPTFYKEYIFPSMSLAGPAIQTSDGGYIVVGNGYIGDMAVVKTSPTGDTLWTKLFDGSGDGTCVAQTTDGGYIFSQVDKIIKTDSLGNVNWARQDSMQYAGAFKIIQTSDGGYIMIGGQWISLLIKLTPSGYLDWCKYYDGFNYNFASRITHVKQTIDGGYILTGYTTRFGSGQSDVYLMKIDAAGNIMWSRTYGGSYDDFAYYVQQTSDGGYIVAGHTSNFGLGPWDAYLIRTDADGNLIWSKCYGEIYEEYGFTVEQTTDGGYIVCGLSSTFTEVNYYNTFFLKIDSIGTLMWTHILTDTTASYPATATQLADGGYLISSSRNISYPIMQLIKTDSSGGGLCNEQSVIMIENNAATIVTNPIDAAINYPDAMVDIAVTETRGGIVNTPCSVSTGKDVDTISFQISPNPSPNTFTIRQTFFTSNNSLSVYNCLGSEVYQTTLTSPEQTITTNLSSGIYFVRVVNEDGGSAVEKLVVE
jgi:hypothetical protein